MKTYGRSFYGVWCPCCTPVSEERRERKRARRLGRAEVAEQVEEMNEEQDYCNSLCRCWLGDEGAA